MFKSWWSSRSHPPPAPWLASLPDDPGRVLIRRFVIGILIVTPFLPLLMLPFNINAAVLVFGAIALAMLSLVIGVGVFGMISFAERAYQYCPRCYTRMHRGAVRCRACHFEPGQEEGIP